MTIPDGDGHDDDGRDDSGDAPRGMAGVDVQPMPALDREQVEALRKENDELRDQLLRRRAEFDNYRKRTERERQQAGAEAVADLLSALIPTLDNLDRALSSAGAEKTLRQGVELTRRELLALLEKQGVKVEDPVGQRFDPERHQALSHEIVPGKPDGTVVEVFRKGYSHRDRLLRPALVKVAKGQDGGEAGPDAVH